VVLELISRLPNRGSGFAVALDNLFPLEWLFTILRELGSGAYGTCRTANTARELVELGLTSSEANLVMETYLQDLEAGLVRTPPYTRKCRVYSDAIYRFTIGSP
jgi:hypothetical protein